MTQTKKSNIFLAVLFLVFQIPVIFSFYDDYMVFTKGHVTEVIIKSLPASTNSKGAFMAFDMNGQLYSKKVYGNVRSYLYVGEKIKLKYLEGYENDFLFPDENPVIWGIALMLLLLFLSILCIYNAFWRISDSNNGKKAFFG